MSPFLADSINSDEFDPNFGSEEGADKNNKSDAEAEASFRPLASILTQGESILSSLGAAVKKSGGKNKRSAAEANKESTPQGLNQFVPVPHNERTLLPKKDEGGSDKGKDELMDIL